MDAYLTRQPNVISEVGFHRQTVALKLAHLARVASENFNPAGSATRVATAAVKNVDASILDDEYQLLSLRRFDGLGAGRSGGFNVRHLFRNSRKLI